MMTRVMRSATAVLAAMAGLAVAGLGSAGPASAQTPADCGQLSGLKIEQTNLLSATLVPAADGLPQYCRVLGYVRPAINFEIRLPSEGWNGKFYMAGCGGFCGTLDSDRPGHVNAANHGLRRNYAVLTTDAGHWGANVYDGRWAYHNPVARADLAWRAVTESARVGKAITRAYFKSDLKKSYFAGCSNGGRQALMEAQRFPDDFDGIIAGAPALDLAGLAGALFPWLVQSNAAADGNQIFGAAKVKLVQQAVAKACGGPDGLIEDPRTCTFKPASLACSTADGADCLTAAEVEVVEKWYAGPTSSSGKPLFEGGLPAGSEFSWITAVTGDGVRTAGASWLFANSALRYLLFMPPPGEGYQIGDYSLDSDLPRALAQGAIFNTTNPDLARFKARGGKLILWHGWADALVTPFPTIAYYQAVQKKMGGRSETEAFARLFMIPGMDHCGASNAGPGIDQLGFDPLTALEQWVEQGKAPEMLPGTKSGADGRPLWSRPLCPFPQVATYAGSGERSDAANWRCGEPAR